MADWTVWKNFTPSILGRVPQHPGVYQIALDGMRCKYPLGNSSTIYYGMSRTSIRTRLDAHFRGRGNGVVSQFLAQGYPVKVRWWRTIKDPRSIECNLLDQFEVQFGMRPAGNTHGCATD